MERKDPHDCGWGRLNNNAHDKMTKAIDYKIL